MFGHLAQAVYAECNAYDTQRIHRIASFGYKGYKIHGYKVACQKYLELL